MDDAYSAQVAKLISLRVEENDAISYAEFTAKLLITGRTRVNSLIADYFAETFDNWAHYFVMTVLSHDNLPTFEAMLRSKADTIVRNIQTPSKRLPKLDGIPDVAPLLEVQLAGRISYWKAKALKRLRTNELKNAATSRTSPVPEFEPVEPDEIDDEPADQSIPPSPQNWTSSS